MRTPVEEHARWTAEWATHARDACWGCPGMTWEVDAAWSMLLFQHLEADAVRGYLAEVARVLRPGSMFRFQWCVGSTDSPYAHDHDPLDIVEWADDAGLLIGDCPQRDPDWPTWGWATAIAHDRLES